MERNYKNVLIAVDGSEPSKNAFLKSLEVANRHEAELTIMHVVDSRPYRGIRLYDVNYSKRALEHGEALVKLREDEAKENNIKSVSTVVLEGAPKSAIVKYVQQNPEIDIVICGATGINAVERMVIGSVADHVVKHARCDVLVVKNN